MSEQQQQQNADAGTGAEGSGDALDDLDAALGQDGAGAEGGEPQEWQPPTREEYEEIVRAREAAEGKLKRARGQAQKLRESAKSAPGAAEGAGQDGPDLAPEVDKWKGAAIRQAGKAALLARGADPEMVDLALGRLRAGEVEVDADGEPELEDWLDEMQERYPKLFAKAPAGPGTQTGPRPVRGVDQGRAAAGRAPQRPMSLGEQIIANSEAARVNAARRR